VIPVRLFREIMEAAVPICAIVGCVTGIVGSWLGLANRRKIRRQERVEADQNLVRVRYAHDLGVAHAVTYDLCVANDDTRTVVEVQVEYFSDETCATRALEPSVWPSLAPAPHQERVRAFTQSVGSGRSNRPTHARIAYVDSAGRKHGPYVQRIHGWP
jgi:hypothetical protein